jgi:DNA topoisomerase-1
MRTAQRLYEGVNIGDGEVGLITYMRTDSTNLAGEALSEIRAFVAERYGATQLPEQPRFYKTKAKNAQEAHEAIRPTSVSRTPEALRGHLDSRSAEALRADLEAHGRLPDDHALYDTGRGRLSPRLSSLRANGSILVEPGFLAVYQEGREDQEPESGDEQDRVLPPLAEASRPAPRAPSGAAFHGAAAALQRGEPRQGARGIRDRPAFDLREHHLDAAPARVRRARQAALHPDRHWPHRQ